jgi:cyclin E
MLKVLRWNIGPVTSPDWLSLYLQCLYCKPSISIPSGCPSSSLPGHSPTPTGQTSLALNSDRNFPRDTFVKIMQLLDLCILSTESLRFPPGLLTAAALYHFSCQKVALDVSGYSRDELNSCVRWMTPLAKALAHDGLKPMKKISGKYESECHNFQPWDKPLETLTQPSVQHSGVSTLFMY